MESLVYLGQRSTRGTVISFELSECCVESVVERKDDIDLVNEGSRNTQFEELVRG